VLPVDERLGQALKGIPWRKLNEQYKRYDAVMELVKAQLKDRGIPGDEVERYIDAVMERLKGLGLRLESRSARANRAGPTTREEPGGGPLRLSADVRGVGAVAFDV